MIMPYIIYHLFLSHLNGMHPQVASGQIFKNSGNTREHIEHSRVSEEGIDEISFHNGEHIHNSLGDCICILFMIYLHLDHVQVVNVRKSHHQKRPIFLEIRRPSPLCWGTWE